MVVSSRQQRFPRSYRLRRREEFLRVQNRGLKLHLSRFLVFAIGADHVGDKVGNKSGNDVEAPGVRLGVTVTKKVGHAVFRNRIKRWVREAFRRERSSFPEGWDVVFIAKRQCVSADYASVLRDVRGASKQLRRRSATSADSSSPAKAEQRSSR